MYWDKVKKFIEGKAFLWLIIFISFCLAASTHPAYYPKNIQMVSNILLSILTISLAYTLPHLGKVLKGNDISYGMYIYHMLVINTLVSLGYIEETKYLFLAIGLTTALSLISWLFVEKKALALKTRIK
jgi:peptidoglycan/LPS O-acetylase OafA/YrhL